MTVAGMPTALANTNTTAIASTSTSPSRLTALAQAPEANVLTDGIYLYGQADTANQIGSAYMVFEVNDSQVVGAFYMPQSSFDCFQGEFQDDQLALNVVDSYERTVHPYAIALNAGEPIAQVGEEVVTPVGLEGFHPIGTLSEMDQRILATCQADFE